MTGLGSVLSPRPIAIVQGASGAVVQRLLACFAERIARQWRVVGVVEHEQGDAGPILANLDGKHAYSLFQDLGPASTACSLRADGLAAACHDVCQQIAHGCDLVVLSKFGKLEAERRAGLMDAFVAATSVGIPVITSVAPKFFGAWESFAGPYFVVLPPRISAIERWWALAREHCGIALQEGTDPQAVVQHPILAR